MGWREPRGLEDKERRSQRVRRKWSEGEGNQERLGCWGKPRATHLKKKVVSNFRCCQAKATGCDPINIQMTLAREVFIVQSKIKKGSQKQAWGGGTWAAGDGGEREDVFRRKKQAGGGMPM